MLREMLIGRNINWHLSNNLHHQRSPHENNSHTHAILFTSLNVTCQNVMQLDMGMVCVHVPINGVAMESEDINHDIMNTQPAVSLTYYMEGTSDVFPEYALIDCLLVCCQTLKFTLTQIFRYCICLNRTTPPPPPPPHTHTTHTLDGCITCLCYD